MHNAELIISAGGAELTYISFARKCTSVLELLRSQTNEIDQPSLGYLNLSSCLGLFYYYQFCLPLRINYSGNNHRINVDLKLLKKNIDLILLRITKNKSNIESTF
jgi:hypothetical protein